MAKNSPWSIEKCACSTATKSPNSLRTPSSWMTALLIAGPCGLRSLRFRSSCADGPPVPDCERPQVRGSRRRVVTSRAAFTWWQRCAPQWGREHRRRPAVALAVAPTRPSADTVARAAARRRSGRSTWRSSVPGTRGLWTAYSLLGRRPDLAGARDRARDGRLRGIGPQRRMVRRRTRRRAGGCDRDATAWARQSRLTRAIIDTVDEVGRVRRRGADRRAGSSRGRAPARAHRGASSQPAPRGGRLRAVPALLRELTLLDAAAGHRARERLGGPGRAAVSAPPPASTPLASCTGSPGRSSDAVVEIVEHTAVTAIVPGSGAHHDGPQHGGTQARPVARHRPRHRHRRRRRARDRGLHP